MLVVAQISDLHFCGDSDRRDRINGVLDYLRDRCGGATNIDALVVSGDLTDEGSAEQYREAADTLVTGIPTLTLLGNHDDRAAYRSVSRPDDSGDPYAPVNSVLQLDGLLILALDSSIPGHNQGAISEETLAWASDQIAAAGDVPVLVAFHHPPTAVGMPFMDTIAQTDPSGLEAFVRAHPAIIGLVCGHIHSPSAGVFAGVPVTTAPGVSSTLNLPFEGDGVVNDTQPAGIAFHIIDGHRLTTHFRSVC
ncbi:metallophosphoesterase [Gordonia sp. HY002]|uniref:metallophosphoesterase n=1 Tax=Gordonia zhenghanii TaxID=2911516 RepID=UPI001EF069EA|nr:metallophosphoesterase [Gordonia zhenghanii]MCF8571940.1 metallophosphoesterase [Gordonia zhenghanii]MCF8606982.1 metallophosphoesterase [Gordonia zhenghanii]